MRISFPKESRVILVCAVDQERRAALTRPKGACKDFEGATEAV